MFDLIFYYFQISIFVLVSVAFLTLLERKVLGYSQIRKGPNKLGMGGVLQPFSDAVKLFSKEESSLFKSNFFFFWVSPFFGFLCVLIVWVTSISYSGLMDFKMSVLFFLCCISFSAYGIIFSGWSSNSKYSLLGGLRAVAQTVSYEIVLSLIFLILFFLCLSLSLAKLWEMQKMVLLGFFMLPMVLCFYICCVVEVNRAPFDLAEGESELVSGFNIEFGSLKFAVIFLAEYSSIVWMSFVTSLLFFGFFLSIKVFFFFFFFWLLVFLILRASYPRIRYDYLMYLTWKKMLPLVLFFYLFILMWV